ncbi:MFS transporter [Actinacidiphila guanduensis]|nr:MFS transporter [Actinacidiphila guanduensis]
MTTLDTYVVTVAVPDLSSDFNHASVSHVSWVLNAYAIAMTAILIVAGRQGDRYGSKSVFLLGTVLFTLASAACALAPGLAFLIIARAVQGVGAAAQLPASLALLLAAVPAERRQHAARLWTGFAAMGAVFGPLVGGLLVEASWRYVFAINLPLGIATFLVGRRVLPDTRVRKDAAAPDMTGSLLLIVSVATLTGALVQAPDWGWSAVQTVALLVVAAVSGAGFVWRCRTHPAPLIEPSMMRNRTYTISNVANLLFSVAYGIMLLSVTLWCQQVWHYSALRTGFALAPAPFVVLPAAVVSAGLIRRLGLGPVAALGGVVYAASALWLVLGVHDTPDYAFGMLPTMVASGVGFALGSATLTGGAVSALPPAQAGTATSIVNAGRQVSGCLGVAVLVTVIGTAPAPSDIHHLFNVGWCVATGLALLSAVVALSLKKPARVEQPELLSAA